jgi:hypothetical protein
MTGPTGPVGAVGPPGPIGPAGTISSVTSQRLIGRASPATGAPEEILLAGGLEWTAGATSIQRSALAGDVTAAVGSNSTAIGANKVVPTMLSHPASGNLVPNPDFADGLMAAASTAGWSALSTVWTPVPRGGAAPMDSCPTLFAIQMPDNAAAQSGWATNTYFDCLPGETFWVSVWAAKDSGIIATNALRLRVSYRNTNGAITNVTAKYLDPTTTWTKYEGEVIIPPGAAGFRVGLYRLNSAGAGVAYVTRVMAERYPTIDRIPVAAPFGPSGSTHAEGLVPDPGAVAGTARFLREDRSWGVPAGTGAGLSNAYDKITAGGITSNAAGADTLAFADAENTVTISQGPAKTVNLGVNSARVMTNGGGGAQWDGRSLKIGPIANGSAATDAASVGQVNTSIAAQHAYFQTVAEATAASIPSALQSVAVLSKTTAGDGGQAVYKKEVGDPGASVAGKFQSVDGAWWGLSFPGIFEAAGEVIDFRYFVLRYADRVTALKECIKRASSLAKAAGVIDFHGIQVLAPSPIVLRDADMPGDLPKYITFRSLEVLVDSASTYVWKTYDYLFSIAEANGQLSNLLLDGCFFNTGTKPIIACHATGFHHITFHHPRIDIQTGAIGIGITKYIKSTGIGTGEGNVESGSHGFEVIEPDIDDVTPGGVDTTSIGIYVEGGDCQTRGGWITTCGTGYVCYGGQNIRNVHFSMGLTPEGLKRCAIEVRGNPQTMQIINNELDKCYILIDDQPSIDGVVGNGSFQRLDIRGNLYSVDFSPLPPGYGLTTFKARVPNSFLSGLNCNIEGGLSVSGQNLVAFVAAASASVGDADPWDLTAYAPIRLQAGTSNVGALPGTGYRIQFSAGQTIRGRLNTNRMNGGTQVPSMEVASVASESGSAIVSEGNLTSDGVPFGEFFAANRGGNGDGQAHLGRAGMRAYRNGGNATTRLAWYTMSASVEKEWMGLDNLGKVTMGGALVIHPSASETPANDGDVTFQLNGAGTQLTIKAKQGGTVRSVALALA